MSYVSWTGQRARAVTVQRANQFPGTDWLVTVIAAHESGGETALHLTERDARTVADQINQLLGES